MKKLKIKQTKTAKSKSTKLKHMTKQDDAKEMKEVDAKVKAEGEKDVGQPALKLCPRCGSMDLGFRRIDIPGFAPELQVCNRCGFRSEAAVEVRPIEYFEEVEDEESKLQIEEIEKRLQRAGIGKIIDPKLKKKLGEKSKPKAKLKIKLVPTKVTKKQPTKVKSKPAKKKR
ncbi:MAG: hypothetical protein V1722_00125 [Candidatus Micrarchaeota archaeon]